VAALYFFSEYTTFPNRTEIFPTNPVLLIYEIGLIVDFEA